MDWGFSDAEHLSWNDFSSQRSITPYVTPYTVPLPSTTIVHASYVPLVQRPFMSFRGSLPIRLNDTNYNKPECLRFPLSFQGFPQHVLLPSFQKSEESPVPLIESMACQDSVCEHWKMVFPKDERCRKRNLATVKISSPRSSSSRITTSGQVWHYKTDKLILEIHFAELEGLRPSNNYTVCLDVIDIESTLQPTQDSDEVFGTMRLCGRDLQKSIQFASRLRQSTIRKAPKRWRLRISNRETPLWIFTSCPFSVCSRRVEEP